MDFSMFYAKFIGYYSIIVTVGMLVNVKRFQAFVLAVADNNALMMILGIMRVIFGLIMVLTHSVWHGWPIIVTIIGYVTLFAGILDLYCTNWVLMLVSRARHTSTYYFFALAGIFIGLVLLYFGYNLRT
ncbi:MAG: hypothetical protein BGO43_02965 [Gammaproteobacteria bacterium 39-13]|nr:hypothetical protein [Gammaproteobacteria bacterium]OJV85662.1 MAG: hypothetical protein BGO43_02965 [Gammaproteobacteria bacterium 39-13]